MSLANRAAQYFILGAMLTTTLSAAAQQRHPAPPSPQSPAPPSSQSAGPQSTTATYDDWVVQCQTQTAPASGKTCAMVQVTQVQGNNLPFSRVTLAHPEKGQPVKLVVQVPVNVSFSGNLRILFSGADQGLNAPFARCVPAGCFAEFELTEATLKKLHDTSGTEKLSFLDANGRDVNVPLSFKGFARAFDTLAKE